MALQMKECIKSRIKDVDFIEILALPVKIQSSYIQSYNLDKLIEKTIKNVKENYMCEFIKNDYMKKIKE